MFQPIFSILLGRHFSKRLVDMNLFDLLYKKSQVYSNIIAHFSDFSLYMVSFNSINISFSFKYDTK
jgi:hypothetical protein